MRRTLIAALPTATVELLDGALRQGGLVPGRLIPAPAAAASFAEAFVRAGAGPATGMLELHLPGATEITQLVASRPRSLVPVAESFARPPHAGGGLGSEGEEADQSASPRYAVAKRGWPLALDLCASAGGRRRAVLPLSAPLRQTRQSAARRRSLLLAGASAAMLLLAFGLHVVDTRRELSAVLEARRVLAADLQQAMQQRTDVAALARAVEHLHAAETRESRWPELFADLATDLPDAVFLTGVAGRPDSLTLRGSQIGPPTWRASAASLASFAPAPGGRPDAQQAGGEFELTVFWRPSRREDSHDD